MILILGYIFKNCSFFAAETGKHIHKPKRAREGQCSRVQYCNARICNSSFIKFKFLETFSILNISGCDDLNIIIRLHPYAKFKTILGWEEIVL